MNKKFLSAILFGALMVTSTGTFVSCKDYDDDIDRIDQELTDIKSAIAALQSKVDGGKYVTNVAKSGDGLTITWSDNSTSTIETIKGQDGQDGTIVTIVDGYWAFDGVKSEYPATPGESSNGQDAHEIKIEDGYWSIWNSEKGAYEKTPYAVAPVSAAEVKGGWDITIKDASGVQTIFVPKSATLLSITPALNSNLSSFEPDNGALYAQNFNIYYGILNEDVEWKGYKAVNGKMLKGMYPTADRDIKMLLNPSNVDATAYDWVFVSTDNTSPWGLDFGTPQVWVGKATTATRAVTSDNGLWFLPRNIQKIDLNSESMQGRPDYVTQFKSNDGQKYLFALQATDNEGVTVKSDYVYTFKASNVNTTEIALPNLAFNPSNKSFLYGREYAPTFDMWYASDNYDESFADSVLVYDYYLEIDYSKITDESIRKYGVAITEDGYRFIAKNEAVVNNTIPFIYNYILINGKKGSVKFSVNFNDEEAVVSNQYIGDFTAPFNATLVAKQTKWYALNHTFSLEKFFEGLGESGKMKWIDAIARSYDGLTTDPQEIISRIFKKKRYSSDTEYDVELTGGDPINNQATWDVTSYNGDLLDKYINFDYVDKDGKSCLTGNIRDLDKIVGLKVTFLVDSELGHVTPPYYTTTEAQYNGNPNIVALPLNNAFRVEIATRYDQYEVARMNFTFELQQPEINKVGIVPQDGKFTTWRNETDGSSVLHSFGAFDKGVMKLPLYEAFNMWTGEGNALYTAQNPNAQWYQLSNSNPAADGITLIGKATPANVLLSQNSYFGNWTDYITFATNTTTSLLGKAIAADPQVETRINVDVNYDFFGVYPALASQLPFYTDADGKAHPGFRLSFASTIFMSAIETTDEVLNAKAGTYHVFISNDNVECTTFLDRNFVLFDGLDENGTSRSRAYLNSARDFEEAIRPFDIDYAGIKAYYVGLGEEAVITPVATPLTTTKFAASNDDDWKITEATGDIEPNFGARVADDNGIAIYEVESREGKAPTATNLKGVKAHNGGLIIQLGKNIDNRQPIEVHIPVKDALGYVQTLKVKVQKLQD